MSRPFKCDGPGCDTWYRTCESYEKDSTVTVKWNGAGDKPQKLHFCSWDCNLAYGMAFTQRTEQV
jgi:hypothetical protein